MPKSRNKRKNGKIVSGKAFRIQRITTYKKVDVAESVNKAGKVMRKAFSYMKPLHNIVKHPLLTKLKGMGLYEHHYNKTTSFSDEEE